MIENQTQRPTFGLREDFGIRSVWLQAIDDSVVGSAIDSILTIEGDVFGREAVHRQSLNLRQFRILRVDAGEFRRRQRSPRGGIDRHRPSDEIRNDENDEDYEQAEDDAFHWI